MDHQITAITAQKRNPNRVNIYLNGEYAFSLASIVAAWLRKDQVLDDRKIETLLQQDSEEKAFQKALVYLNFRPRSEAEVKTSLEKAGFSEKDIDTTINRLMRAGMIGDERFSKLWLENRAAAHPRSHRLLAFELKKKGVPSELIDEALEGLPGDSRLALEAGRKYARRLETAPVEIFRKKLTGFLARKGFHYGTIQEVLPLIWNETHLKNGASMGENSYG